MAELQGDPNAAIKELRKQTNEVEGVLKNNVEMLVEREGKLNDLEEKAQNLEEGASQFHKNAVQVKKKMWWEHTKAKLGIGGAVTLIILIIIIIIVVKTQASPV